MEQGLKDRFYLTGTAYIDPNQPYIIIDNAAPIKLTPSEYKILEYLAVNQGQTLNYEQIGSYVFGLEYHGDKDNPDGGIRNFISALRGKLRGIVFDKPEEIIKTEVRFGYRLVPPSNATRWGYSKYGSEDHKARFQTKNFSGIGPMSGNRYVPRPEALSAIADMVYRNKISFISGIGGMGKSELARQFAKDSTFAVVLPLELDREGNGSFEEIVSNSYINVVGLDTKDNISIKKFELLSTARDNTLVLVDNLNKMPDGKNPRTGTSELLERLIHSTGEAHILVTSQLGEELLSEYGPVLKIERYQDQTFGLEILSKYAEKLLHDNQDAHEMVELLGNHTMLLALVGKQLVGKNEASLHETLLDLRKSLSEALQIDFVNLKKDHELFVDVTPYDMLKIVFSSVFNWSLSEVDRQILGAIILTPQFCHRTDIITELVGDLPKSSACNLARKSLHRLQALNVVQCCGEEVCLHPLMVHLLSDPDFTETDIPIAELSNNFAFHLLRNAFVSTLVCSISYLDFIHLDFSNIKLCYEIIEYYRRIDRDWTSDVLESNVGWLAFWEGCSTREGINIIDNLMPFKEFVANTDTNNEFLVIYNAIGDLINRKSYWPDSRPTHELVEIIARGPLGACLYFYDCIDQNTRKIIDCSEQLDSKFRYYCQGSEMRQHGAMTHAIIADAYNGYCPRNLVLPSMIEDVCITEIERHFVSYKAREICNVVFPEAIERIGEEAFAGCFFLTKISIPPSIKRIELDAFARCQLDSVVLPYGVELGVSLRYKGPLEGPRAIIPEYLLKLKDSNYEEYPWFYDEKRLKCTLRLGIDILIENGRLKVVEDFCPRVDGIPVPWTTIQTPFGERCKIIIS